MNTDRIKLLEKYIEEDPNEPFNRYALALELAHEEPTKATELLLHLIKEQPDYVPSYYQAAVLLLDHNRYEETRIILEKGVAIARKQNDRKAQAELKLLLEELD